MNSEKLAQRLSEKTGLKMKSCEKAIELIAEAAVSDVSKGISFSPEPLGTLRSRKHQMSFADNLDGSFTVHPPCIEVRYYSPAETSEEDYFVTSQRITERLTSSGDFTYKEASKVCRVFSKLLRKAVAKGKIIKLRGIGTFTPESFAEEDEAAPLSFRSADSFAGSINEPYECLEKKVTFPIPPDSMRKALEVRLAEEPATEGGSTFIERKLALISKDLIKLNEEINKDASKDGRRGLWG